MIRRPPRSTRTDTLFPYTTLFRSLPAILQATLGSASFEYTPKWTYSINGRVKLPVPERVGALVLNAEYYHSDSYLGQDLTIPSSHVVNAKLDWNKALGSPIDVRLYVRNSSEGSRVGKEWCSRCRSRWSAYPEKTKEINRQHKN